MPSTVQEIKAIEKSIHYTEQKVELFKLYCGRMSMGASIPKDQQPQPVLTTEVEAIEQSLQTLYERIVGSPTIPEYLWQPSKPYTRQWKNSYEEYWAHEDEHFRLMLLWLQHSLSFLVYLQGYADEPVPSPQEQFQQVIQSPQDGSGRQYDVAISFAGADRAIASEIAAKIKERRFKVFYDEYEAATLWGVDLYAHLSDVYANRARFCLMLISRHYAERLWTKLERKAAQSRAFKERQAYILPLRIDDTEIEGILDTTGYIHLRENTLDEVVELLLSRLGQSDQLNY